MKFAKTFAQQLPRGAAWHDHALAYTRLKRLVKHCAGLSRHEKLRAETLAQCRVIAGQSLRTDAALQMSPAETAFFTALRSEIQKVNRFFLREQQRCATHLQRLVDAIQNETRAIACRRVADSGHSTQASSGSGQWLPRAGRLYRELRTLEWFCVLNVCAVSKMLKKHDKWTRFDTRVRFEHAVLAKQPFATHAPLLHMMRRVETIALSVSMIALTEQSLWPIESIGGLRKPLALPPLRFAKREDRDEEDGTDMTDSEDRTPRCRTNDYDSSSTSDRCNSHRPRQRPRYA